MMATRIGNRWARGAAIALLAILLAALTGCSGNKSEGGGSSASTSGSGARADGGGSDVMGLPTAAPSAVPAAGPERGTADGVALAGKGALGDVVPQQAAVISTGAVQLRSSDVGQAIFDVGKVVDLHHGSIEQDATETDKHGKPLRSRMVVRVPSADFAKAMADLGKVATLEASSSNSKDVTTDVLDNQVRVQVAKRSINRISVLLDQASTIREVISIESELAQRQADLASLEKQQRYLADQTSMSTITVSVEGTPTKAHPVTNRHHHGFVAGLAGGWRALRDFGVAVATVAGALLPWLVLLALLAVPGWPLVRRLRRRATASQATVG